MKDIFVYDRDPDENGVFDEGNGTTTRVSVSSTGVPGDKPSTRPAISADGRYVAFKSEATNLISGDTNKADDVFLYDRQTGPTERVSMGAGNTEGNGDSSVPAISADGRFVAFRSVATNLVPGFTASLEQVYILDRNNGVLLPVTTDGSGLAGNNDSSRPTISDDGRIVAFHSDAFSLVTDDTNGASDVFVRDLDSDGDGVFEGVDECPNDPAKIAPGACGCGVPETGPDSDDDGVPDCIDNCPLRNPLQHDCQPNGIGDVCDIAFGPSTDCDSDSIPDDCEPDSDSDGVIDDCDGCPNDGNKTAPGVCGCGVPDDDSDGDGVQDCIDGCPLDPGKLEPGTCGCSVPEDDTDQDGIGCIDQCPETPVGDTVNICGCTVEGACCLTGGVCWDGLDPATCEGIAGVYQGDGSTCDDGYRFGDFDFDGEVNLSDFAAFQRCFSGTAVDQPDPDCAPGDFDRCGTIDLGDYEGFRKAMIATASGSAP